MATCNDTSRRPWTYTRATALSFNRAAALAEIVTAYRATAHPDRHNDHAALLRWEWLPKGEHPLTDLYCALMGRAGWGVEYDTVQCAMARDSASILREFDASFAARQGEMLAEREAARADASVILAALAKPDHERSDAEQALARRVAALDYLTPEEYAEYEAAHEAARVAAAKPGLLRRTVDNIKFAATALAWLGLLGVCLLGFASCVTGVPL